ncbi:cation-transporting P-type ATPase [Flaviflexus sp.]|uniref:cation-transporting P-type ATPase n=1 Tax=Flaviflexus sp. TaxID=1969482 RepID=UPI003F93D492
MKYAPRGADIIRQVRETMAEGQAGPHSRSIDDIAKELEVQVEGLRGDEAARRLDEHGPNKLKESEKESGLIRFLRQFKDPMIYVLLGAAVLTSLMQHWVDTIVILAVVLINAVIGYVQEGKAEDALEGIRNMLSLQANARRDGTWVEVPAEDLVPGDVVRLSAGDRVPADIRLTSTSSLRIEEAPLTGESVPVDKSTEAVEDDSGIGDRSSMAFSGTTVAAGSGRGIVTGTAENTELGKISEMLNEVEALETPLTKQMASFSTKLSVFVVILAITMMLVGLIYDYTWSELLLSAIGFAVAAIPEGLPAVLTITLALGVQKMAGKNAITRRMNSVETLGSVTVICSDKTGTLTKNEMTVKGVVTPRNTYQVTGTGYAPDGEIILNDEPANVHEHEDLKMLARIAALVNDSTVSQRDDSWVLSGEPTDGGLRTFAMKAGAADDLEPRISSIPFDSEYKYMATLNGSDDDQVIYLKGAPDRLLGRCSQQGVDPEHAKPIDREYWEAKIDELSSQGLRLLAGAIKNTEPGTDLTTELVDDGGFTFVGLYGIIDPPREEAIEAIKVLKQAGITVKMITGDHAGTATAIGQSMGLGNGAPAVTGAELEKASDEDLKVLARDHDIFARTSPEHKLRLVTALQDNGEVVSMTGDGVNDAPSLKRADVGVAMGIKGTEATKDAADVVLADDNFATIGSAVRMGRTIYDNLRKSIVFMLPTNGAQGLVILVAVLFGLTLPLTPVQVLWVNTITAVTLSLALAFEPAEPDVMNRPPRKPGGSIIPKAGVIRIAYVSLLIGGATIGAFLWGQDQGLDLAVARTFAVNVLVVAQICYLLASRFTRTSSVRKELFTTNPVSWVSIIAMLLLQVAFVYVPFMQAAFSSASVGWQGWLIPLGVGIVVFLVVEADKAIRARTESKDEKATV